MKKLYGIQQRVERLKPFIQKVKMIGNVFYREMCDIVTFWQHILVYQFVSNLKDNKT